MKIYLSIIILIFNIPSSIISQSLIDSTKKYVSVENLKVHETPNSDSKIVGELIKGDFVILIETIKNNQEEWSKIKYDIVGFIKTSSLTNKPPYLLTENEEKEIIDKNIQSIIKFQEELKNIDKEKNSLDYSRLTSSFKSISKLVNIDDLDSDTFRLQLHKNNDQIMEKFGFDYCNLQYIYIKNADKGCTITKQNILIKAFKKYKFDIRELINLYGDSYCKIAYENTHDTCGRSRTGYKIYKGIKE